MLGDDVVASDPEVHGATVDLVEDVRGALEDHLGRPGRQPAHAGAVLAGIAPVNAQSALAQESQGVVFPAFGSERQPQRAHTTAPLTAFSSSARSTRVSA